MEMILGAILTQATAWTNVEKALSNLKAAGLLSIQALKDIPEAELAAMIKPSGYFNAKARKVKAFIDHLWDNYDGASLTTFGITTTETWTLSCLRKPQS